jgi:hypothetical protein
VKASRPEIFGTFRRTGVRCNIKMRQRLLVVNSFACAATKHSWVKNASHMIVLDASVWVCAIRRHCEPGYAAVLINHADRMNVS